MTYFEFDFSDDSKLTSEDFMKTIKWIFSSDTSGVPSTTWVFSHKCLSFGFDMAEFVPTQLNAEEQDKHNPPSSGVILLFQKST